MKKKTKKPRYPRAVRPDRVGKYPAAAFAGGGFVWDEVLEYRVWCHPADGGDDYYYAFPTYPQADACAREAPGAEQPLALILQREYLDEPADGRYVRMKKKRVTEWPVEFLSRPRRTPRTLPDFLARNAPANRLDIIRGLAKAPRSSRRSKRTSR